MREFIVCPTEDKLILSS